MWNSYQLETLYKCACALSVDPRISIRKLHENYSHYSNRDATTKLLKRSFELETIVGPYIYCNSGLSVKICTRSEVCDPIGTLQACKKDLSITRAIALFGEYSFISFKRGEADLNYAEVVKPAFEKNLMLENIKLVKKGKLPSDPFPQDWDDLDWQIYHLMRNPRVSFAKVSGIIKQGKKFDVSWKTIEIRFKNLLKDCKVFVSFFPRGLSSYSQTFLTFTTDFENDLKRELENLDRSTYLYRVKDTILLNLFLDNNIHHRIFVDFEKKGLIQDLHVSIPLYWWRPLPL